MEFKKMCSCCLEESDEIIEATLYANFDLIGIELSEKIWICEDCNKKISSKHLSSVIASLGYKRKELTK